MWTKESRSKWKRDNPLREKKIKKEYNKKHYKKNHQKHLEYGKLYRQRDEVKEKERMRQQKQKLTLITHYSNGTMNCACCGEEHIEFLSIDHINNDGAKHRREIKASSGFNFYSWLLHNNLPEGFQVLCMNCNFAKGKYYGCPHVRERMVKTV